MDRIEIISPDGEVRFYTLDPVKGFTNIGGDPENDLVIADPEVAPFLAVLHHQQKPYRLMLLSDEGQTDGDEPSLNIYQPRPMRHLERMNLGGYILILFEHPTQLNQGYVPPQPPISQPVIMPSASPPASPPQPATRPVVPQRRPPSGARSMMVRPPSTRPEAAPRPISRPLPPVIQVNGVPVTRITSPVVDEDDDFIIAELQLQEITVDVEQTAVYQLTIINGGDLVATFSVRVEGLDESWVTISPRYVNLFEGNRASVTISIAPPRLPTSYAGPHHFALVITSLNYPGRVNRRGATLMINPYYEFSVGEINPRQQSISWFTRTAKASIALTNKGNSNTLFQVDGRDDERGCSFEFQVPGEGANLANQAEFHIPPEQTISLPVLITPHSRQFVALGKRSYTFTITSSMPDGAQLPRSMLGQLKTSPLIGPLLLFLLGLFLLALIVVIFKPSISTFNVDGSSSKIARAGDSVTLYWQASPFTRLVIPELSQDPLDSSVGNITVAPTANAVYQLKGDNWLSRLNPQWFGVEPQTVSVVITPVPPTIMTFGGDKESIITGDSVKLSWQVEGAEKINLINQADGNPKPVPGPGGSLDTGPLDRETTYVLEASNVYIATPIRSDPFIIKVSTPTPTPMPTPAISRFFANPPAIVAGENTTLSWEVTGVDQVSVLGIGDGLPASQSVSIAPLDTTNYVLNAANGPSAAKPQSVTVYVTPAPTATGIPPAPQIKFFTANPDTLILLKGSSGSVELKWSVVGDTTGVEISGPSLGSPIVGLNKEGSLNVSVTGSSLFVLTAINVDQKISANVEAKVKEPTPTTTPAPTNTPLPATATPTATPPAPNIFFFKVEARDSADSGKVTRLSDEEYTVEAGTTIQLSWIVSDDATDVTLSPGGSYGPGPNFLDVPNFSTQTQGKTPAVYALTAKNKNGLATTKNMKLHVMPKPAPQPPSSVNGSMSGLDNTITWSWSGSQDILGFRVYRADVPPGNNFTPVADVGTGARDWTDGGGGSCKIYYVVTLYEDINLAPVETGPSGTSWSSTCP